MAEAAETKSIREFSELDVDFGLAQEAARVELNLLNALEVQSLCESLPFDPLALYCIKTGQRRGSRDWPQIYQLVALHSRDQAKLILELLQADGCASHWVQTDGATLERLRVIDPVGYFIYAASHLIRHRFKMPVVAKQDEREASAEFFQQKIAAHARLSRKFATTEGSVADMAILHVANGHLRQLLNYNPALLRLPFHTLDQIVSSFFAGNLYATISHCFRSWLARETEYFKPEKMFEALEKAKGPGNFRAQRPSNKSRRIDEMVAEIANLGLDLTKFREPVHDKAWLLRRVRANEAAKGVPAPAANAASISASEIKAAFAPVFTFDNPKPGSFAARFAKKKEADE